MVAECDPECPPQRGLFQLVSHVRLCLEPSLNNLMQYSTTEVWSAPHVGTVVNRIVNAGCIKTGDSVPLGPDANEHAEEMVSS